MKKGSIADLVLCGLIASVGLGILVLYIGVRTGLIQ
jgi:hypothetical protein